jgi:hypothetical protein
MSKFYFERENNSNHLKLYQPVLDGGFDACLALGEVFTGRRSVCVRIGMRHRAWADGLSECTADLSSSDPLDGGRHSVVPTEIGILVQTTEIIMGLHPFILRAQIQRQPRSNFQAIFACARVGGLASPCGAAPAGLQACCRAAIGTCATSV